MKAPRVFVSDKEIFGREVIFSGKNSRYLRKVLRLNAGDEVQAFDGTSGHLVKLTSVSQDSVSGLICDSIVGKAEHLKITLAFACVRPGPMQEILRHCTELGVSLFIPLLTERANRRPQEKKERWEAVVASASAQCGRITVPRVFAPTPLSELLKDMEHEQTLLMLSRTTGAVPMWSVLPDRLHKNVLILVGPEGGLEAYEESKAIDCGFQPVSLGPSALRAETAAILATGAIVLSRDVEESSGPGTLHGF